MSDPGGVCRGPGGLSPDRNRSLAPWPEDQATAKRKKRKKRKNKKTPPACVPDPPAATCAGRCGFWTNNCGQSIACLACSGAEQCLSNGSCALPCTFPTGGTPCPDACGCSFPNAEGKSHCILSVAPGPYESCQATAECAPGFQCSPSNEVLVCLPLCAG